MKDKKSMQTPDHRQTGPGQKVPRNGPDRRNNVKDFYTGVGARKESTKND